MRTAGTVITVEYNGNPLDIISDGGIASNSVAEHLIDSIGGTCVVSGTVEFEMTDYDWLVFYAFIYSFIYNS